MKASPATGNTDSVDRWIIVDLERILHLPQRLRRLWPAKLLPHRIPQDSQVSSPTEAGPGEATGPGTPSATVGNRSTASAEEEYACVAPIVIAVSRFISTGSIATTARAPAIAAPWTAFWPRPPQPTTAT